MLLTTAATAGPCIFLFLLFGKSGPGLNAMRRAAGTQLWYALMLEILLWVFRKAFHGRRWVFTLGLLCGACVALVGLFWPPPAGLAGAKYDLIKTGMTLGEVESIIGCPADRSGTVFNRDVGLAIHVCYVWSDEGGDAVEVDFVDGAVAGKRFAPGRSHGICGRISRWLGLGR